MLSSALRSLAIPAPGCTEVIVLCGPNAAGKSTYARQHAQRGDLIVDMDVLASAIAGSCDPHEETPASLLPFLRAVYDALLVTLAEQRILQPPSTPARAFICTLSPTARERAEFVRDFGARIVVIETPAETCFARIAADPIRRLHRERWEAKARNWWRVYRRRPGDEIVGA